MPKELTDAGGTACASAKDVAAQADTIFIMVPDTPHVEQVLFGESGVADGLTAGKTVVDMSSISPIATKDFAKRDQRARLRLHRRAGLGRRGRRQGRHPDHHVRRQRGGLRAGKPLLDLMGKNITLVGGNGDGQTSKVANQIIVALNIEAVGEALLFASKAGADPAKVREALMGGFASSKILEVHGERMIKRTFDPGFRIELHQKDLNLALSSARQMGDQRCRTRRRAQELFNSCAATAAGLGPLGAGPGARNDGQSRGRRSHERPDRHPSCCGGMFDAAVASAQPALACRRTCPGTAPRAARRHRRRQGLGGDGPGGRGPLAGPLEGLVVTRYGYGVPASGSRSSRPRIRSQTRPGLAAAERMLDMVRGLTADDLVFA